MWSMVVSTEPHATKDLPLPPKRSLVTSADNLIWIPYVDEGMLASRLLIIANFLGALATHSCIQPARIPAVFSCYCQLSELIHRASCRQSLPVDESRAEYIVQTYAIYLSWYDSAPELLQVGKESTPSVLFLQ